jgi:hypothetical protein
VCFLSGSVHLAAFKIVTQVGNRPLTFGEGCVTISVFVQCDLQLVTPLGSPAISVDLQAVSAFTRLPERAAVRHLVTLNDEVRNKPPRHNYINN